MVRYATVNENNAGKRNTRKIVHYAKRLANVAALLEGHGYAEVWERTPRKCIYAIRHKDWQGAQ